jgi:hypothetical protein
MTGGFTRHADFGAARGLAFPQRWGARPVPVSALSLLVAPARGLSRRG